MTPATRPSISNVEATALTGDPSTLGERGPDQATKFGEISAVKPRRAFDRFSTALRMQRPSREERL